MMTISRFSAALVLAAALLVAGGCGGDSRPAGDGRPVVVATMLPIYVLALDVVGRTRGVELSTLLPAGAGCPHDYALSPDDAQKLSVARLVLANGAGLEGFLTSGPVSRLLKGVKVVDLSEGLKLIPNEGHEHEAEREAGHEHGHAHDHGEFNGHTFASPRNAAHMVRRIAEALARLDPADAAEYRRNAEAAAGRLEALAAEMAAAAATFPNRRIVTTHDVFAYLARDAGLEVVAVIEAEPGQEPGLGEFAGLVARVRAARPAAIFSEPQYSDRPARALSRETGVPVHSLDPFATGRAEAGAYLAAQRRNLETLKRALGAPRGG